MARLAGTAAEGSRLVRAQPVVALILAITFFAGMSTEANDRLWEAHFLRDIGLPELWTLEPIWWFALFRIGEMLLGMAGTTILLKRIQRFPAQSMARILIVLTDAPARRDPPVRFRTGLIVGLAGFWLYNLTRSLVQPGVHDVAEPEHLRLERSRDVISFRARSTRSARPAAGRSSAQSGTCGEFAPRSVPARRSSRRRSASCRALRHGGRRARARRARASRGDPAIV